jgi:ribosomal protein S18 acetylase RimI-like enzyme
MSIKFRPLTKHDANYSKVFDLYEEAFPEAQRVPSWILRYKLKKGKAGFNIIYAQNTWIGFIYTTEYRDIVFIQFFAISESCRSVGYGSKVMESMREVHSGKRIVLNVEELDEQAGNYHQRIERKAFYGKNGFSSSGYIVKEPNERLEMLILGGSISKEEIEAMYKNLFGSILGFFLRPEVIKI